MIAPLAFLALLQASELHEAARACDPPQLKQLLAKKPPIDALDNAGHTPLRIAVDVGKPECVRLLLEAGADKDLPNRDGRSAFNAFINLGNQKQRAALAPLFFSPQQAQSGAFPWTLEDSIPRGQNSVTAMLLQMGADPNRPGSNGSTPLADASFKGDVDVVRTLIDQGARLTDYTKSGTLPIHEAALADSAAVIRELAAQGADINARTRDEKQTALHLAATMGRLKALEALIALKADPNLKDKAGLNPLESARRVGLAEAIALLTKHFPN